MQIWQLILQYLSHTVESHPQKALLRSETLLFLFALPHCAVGTAYPLRLLSKAEKIVMQHFCDFGAC